MKNKLTTIAVLAASLWAPHVYGADLNYVFERALKDDPLLSSANYLRYAAQGDKGKACGELFPQVTLPGSYIDYDQDETGTIIGENSTSTVGAINGNQWGYGIALSQTLFDMPKFAACRTGRIRINHNDAKYEVAHEDLIQRVVMAYIEVLSARNEAKAAASTVELFEILHTQSQKSFSSRTASKREVDAAAAKLEVARANKITTDNNLMVARMGLESLVNGTIPLDELAVLQNVTITPIKPADPAHWATVAEKQNLSLLASQLGVKVADYGVKSANAEHWPTINVFAKHTDYDSDIERSGSSSIVSDNGNFSTDAVGVKFQWKIFAGGSNISGVKAAKNLYMSAEREHEARRRSTRLSAQRAVANLMSYEATIKASSALVVSSKADLEAVRSGEDASTSTSTDVLDARLKLLEAETRLDQARYDYVVGMVEFWKTIGALSAGSITEINRMLTAPKQQNVKQSTAG